MLAIDFETYLINSKEPSPKPVCISWYDGKETGLVVGFHNIMKFLEKALQEPLIVAHNMKFELGVIYRWYPELISKIDEGLENDQFICTKINEELLDATRSTKVTVDEEKSGKKKGYSLSELVRVYFKEDISGSKKGEDAWRLRYSELDEVPLEQWPQEAVDYAISDSIWAYKLAEVQLVGLAGRDITSSVSAEHYLTVMSNYGMLVDQSRVEILEAEIKSKMKLPIEFLISKKMMRVEEESVKDNTTALNKLIVKNVDKDNIKINSRNSISLTKAALKKYIEVAKTEESKETLSKYLEFTFTNKGCEEAKKYLLDKGLLVVKPLKYVKSAANFQKYLEDNVPGDILRRTAKGFIQTSKEKLEEYDNGEDEVIKSFVRIAQYEKVITSFTSRLKEADPYIRTDYSGVKRTCRTSSSTTKAYPSVNIQQMPRSVDDVTYTVRNCFIPRPGYKICSIDYSGLELASAGHMLFRFYGEGRLRDTLNKGDKPMDLHSYLASRIMSMQTGAKISYEEFLSRKKEKEFKNLRQISKQVGLGFPGGLGYSTLRSILYKDGVKTKYAILAKSKWENNIISEYRRYKDKVPDIRVDRIGVREWALVYDELVSLKKELMELYPELGEFLTEGHHQFMTGEKVRRKGDFGEWEWAEMYRYSLYGFERDWCTYTEFCNGYLMQSPAAVGAKRAVCGVVRKYKQSDLVRPLAFIHDEMVFEVKDCKDMYLLVDDVADIMITQMQTVLDSVRVAAEADIMDYWMKEGGFFQKTYFKDPVYKNKTCKTINRR